MPKFEVAIVYKGQTNYIVEAPDQESAEYIAIERFQDNADPDVLGNEWEEIQNIASYPYNPTAEH